MVLEQVDKSFKCCNCGRMFAANGRKKARCPSCGHLCSEPHCHMVDASDEGY